MDKFFSWGNEILGKKYYFFYYYVPKRLTDHERYSRESIQIQHNIWNFKDGNYQDQFINVIEQLIKNSFNNLEDLTLVCIPASTISANRRRYEYFSNKICKDTGLKNGFDHIQIVKEKEPKHLTGERTNAEYSFDSQFFSNKNVILFDDVVTRGQSMRDFIKVVENLGATVVGCVSIGKTYYGPTCGYNPCHPLNNHYIRDLNTQSIENNYFDDIQFEGFKTKVVEDRSINKSQENSSLISSNYIEKSNKTLQDSSPKESIKVSNQTCDKNIVKLKHTYKVGDFIKLGHFKNVPIEWEILSINDNEAVIISKYGLHHCEYNYDLINTTWAECSLRIWLNKVFLQRSFTEEERKKFLKHNVKAECIDGHELNPGEDTDDYVHILSVSEYIKYFNENHPWKCLLLPKKIMKQCWLRNYGKDRMHAAFIGRSGTIHEGGSLVNSPRNAVRPVMVIKL